MKRSKSTFSFLSILSLALVFVAGLGLPFSQISEVLATESTLQEKTLLFLTDVVLLDLSQYNVQLLSIDEPLYSSELYGNNTQKEVRYELINEETEEDATFVFENGIFSWCQISNSKGPRLYTQAPPSNIIDAAKGLVERYQNNSGSSRFQKMIDILESVDNIENTTVTLDNIKLEIKVTGLLESFTWFYINNGIEIKALSILFDDGILWTFREHWSSFTVGSTTINVSEEEAINLALNAAKDISWTVNGEEISNFTILDDPTRTELNMQARQPLILYPHWRVDLSLDTVYLGGVSSIAVGIWADTGTINYVQELSYGGSIPEFPLWTPFLISGLFAVFLMSIIYRRNFFQDRRK
jgi:hypothetical protein